MNWTGRAMDAFNNRQRELPHNVAFKMMMWLNRRYLSKSPARFHEITMTLPDYGPWGAK
jgi:hypothetical protein